MKASPFVAHCEMLSLVICKSLFDDDGAATVGHIRKIQALYEYALWGGISLSALLGNAVSS